MFGLAVFLFGLVIGSFLNVVILRLNTGESLIRGGSRCFFCRNRLRWRDLIPVVSFIIHRGHCQYCHARISIQYPLVELLTGVVFFTVWLKIGLLFSIFSVLFSILIVISIYDIRHKIIPDSLVYLFIGFGLVHALFSGSLLFNYALPAILYSLFFASLWFFSKGRLMGFGDAKLVFGIGMMLSWPVSFWAIIFSFWIGGIFAIISMVAKKTTLKTEVPFGPFLSLGALVAFLMF